jgi:hypothetical protein
MFEEEEYYESEFVINRFSMGDGFGAGQDSRHGSGDGFGVGQDSWHGSRNTYAATTSGGDGYGRGWDGNKIGDGFSRYLDERK